MSQLCKKHEVVISDNCPSCVLEERDDARRWARLWKENCRIWRGACQDTGRDYREAMRQYDAQQKRACEAEAQVEAARAEERARCLNKISSYVATTGVIPHQPVGLALQAIMKMIEPTIRETPDA
jgi:hypothetical protein